MLPMYRYMDSHPHQRNQMPFPQNHCSTCAAAPPQMGFEWRPYSGNYGHPMPCCNHSYFPGYYSFPPYHQMAPPTPFQWHGCHPMYPEPYPVHYAPAPYYSMEQPRPQYEKNDSGNHHCCGFSNHNWKGGNNVKIEEHEVDDGKKERESLVPAGLKDCPYPIVWIPPGYMKKGENREPVQSDMKEQRENRHEAHDAASPKSFSKSIEWEPGVWTRWFPPDSNGFRSVKEGREGKSNQQSEDKNASHPFPIILMPTFHKIEEGEEKEHKQNNSASKPAEEPHLNFKIIPLKVPDVDDGGNKPRATEENSGGQGGLKIMGKNANQKNIPVKEREAHEEDNISEHTEGKWEGNATKHGEDGRKKEPSDSAKGQSSSSPKMAKLPPVCLRVDPLPRKKNGNGSSRSPSPPGQRGKSQETSNDTTKGSSPSEGSKGSQETTINKSHRLEPNRKEIKVVEGVEQRAGQNVDNNYYCGSQDQVPTHTQSPVNLPIDPRTEVSDDPTAEKPGVAGGEYQAKKDEEGNAEDKISKEVIEGPKVSDKSQSDDHEWKIGEDKAGSEVEEKKSDEASKAEKKILSDSEAAVIIQSAYRGFEVRKWEPLKKLKQLAKVRGEANEIRSRIQALESLSDLQRDDRQRVIIGETIMSLLLKLDAIQGLHPNLRNIRKSLARELVSLQEKLDSLMNQKTEVSVVEELAAKPVENLTNDACMAGGKDEEKDEEATESLQDNSSEYNSDKTFNSTEPSQSPPEVDASAESQREDTSEPMSLEEEIQVKAENDSIGVQEKSDVEPHAADMGPVLEESKEEHGNGNVDVSQVVTSEPNSGSGLEETVELSLVTEKGDHEIGFAEHPLGDTIHDSNAANKIEVAEAGDTTPPINEGHLEMNELAELPQGANEEETAMNAIPELEKDEKIEAEGGTVQEGDQGGCNKTIDVPMADYEAPDMNEPEQHPVDENPETHELEALPQHVTEEEPVIPAVSESKNDEKIEAGEAKVSEDSQAECGEAIASRDDETPDMNQLEEHSTEAETKDLASDELQKEEVLETEEPFAGKELCNEEDGEDHGAINADDTNSSGADSTVVDSQKKEEPIEETKESLEGKFEPQEVVLKEEVLETEEPQAVVSFAGKEPCNKEDGEDHGAINADDTNSSGADFTVVKNLKEEVPIEETKEEYLEGKFEPQEVESAISNNPKGSETAREEEAPGLQSRGEPTGNKVVIQKTGTEPDEKLIEENKKLREMMEQLINAGKEQLTVISNLTGRVRDLERQLSRKKKLRTRRHRAAAAASPIPVKP